jgi:hypothetical protein
MSTATPSEAEPIGRGGGASSVAATIADVIARMEAIDRELPRKDGVAYFNRLYLQVTKAVRAASATTTFEDPLFLDRLDVVFAGLYFSAEDTIASGSECPQAWRPLIAMRDDALSAVQFALAGMNAHINHDLPLAVVQTCEELGLAPSDDSPQHRDFQQVNALLKTVEGQVAGWFQSGLVADVEDVMSKPVAYAIAMWSIVAARDIAWGHAQILWHLRGEPALASIFADTLARTVELSSHGILI